MKRIISGLLALCLVTGCSVNAVTGRNQFSIVSEAQEKQIGAEQYSPSQQSQGGEYETDPVLTAYVSEVGQRIAAVSDRPLDYEFVVLNNGVPNAWALPGGKIAVNRGLLTELNNEAELAAVLGHEVVHAAAGHGAQAMTRGTLLQGAMVIGAIASRNNEFSDYIVGASQLGAQLITQRYGRDAERESDYYGIHYMVRAGYDPHAAVSLQQTFVRLSEGSNPGWLEGMFASHPPSQERVANNQALVNELMPTLAGRDLETGEARYQQAVAFLKKTEPAYDLFDEAEQAIADDDLEVAREKVDAAIKLVPREARFHGLKGDIDVYQGNYRAALRNYDEALQLDNDYFDYYLGRGVAHARLDQQAQARQDLERSSKLLPTAIAYNELGKLSIASGDRAAARQYFGVAAQGKGSVGQQAQEALMRLNLQDNPAVFIKAEPYVDNRGRLLARVSNSSNVQFRLIQVDFAAVINGGIQRQSRVLNLQAASYRDVNSGLVFPQGVTPTPDMVRVEIARAQP
jgi:predicted Zn-dependent protease